MNPTINSDTRFVEPNRRLRLRERADVAKMTTQRIRSSNRDRALLLSTPGSVNWRTGGLSDPIDITASSDFVWTLDCSEGSALITNEIEAPRLERDYRVQELGWSVLSVPWYDAAAQLDAACEFANVKPQDLLSENDQFGHNIRAELIANRLVLSDAECDDLRDLGALVGEALSVGIDSWRPGISTDFEIAGAISEVLETRGAKAVCLIVGGDERLRSFRHPLAIGEVIHDAAMAVVVARRAGLHVAATRICVRRADDDIVSLIDQLDAVHHAVLESSLAGRSWGDAVDALAAGYEKIGQPGAWREHFQGGPIGFEQREFELAPGQSDSPFWHLGQQNRTAIAWNPSIRGGAKIEETYLVGDTLELVSVSPNWPLVTGPRGSVRSALKVLQ